ncbi:hypothetical protein [Vibrio penaeicida]|uniref:Uncharacterized protein n=1 Tax=Vibrio penaeicida TaxID=104609 RepID=A0AAV5NX40_9VIBR|nr:hypothetical protein [Vibrio penaeicida]GLQ74824.1 hypothetical protein GCM10007932_41860 [Vibrio penaeicida]
MKDKLNKITLSLLCSGLIFSGVTYAQKPVEETATATTIRAVNKAGGFVANVGAYTSNFTPYKVNFVSGKAGAFGAVLGVVDKLTTIFVEMAIDAECKSNTSYDRNENVCEVPPSFRQDNFCIANTDNVNNRSIRVYISDYVTPLSINTRNPEAVEIGHGEEACFSVAKEVGSLAVVNGNNEVVFDRVMPKDFYSGNYGLVIKNGKPWLKQKRSRKIYNITLAHKLCYNIMINHSFDMDNGVRKCMDRVSGGNPAQVEKYFTNTMQHADYQDVKSNILLKTRDLNDFLANAVYHQKDPSNPDLFLMSGTLMIDDNTYAHIEPVDVPMVNGSLSLPDSINVYKINTTPRNAPNFLDETSMPDAPVVLDSASGPLDFATAKPVSNNTGTITPIDF